MIIERIDLYEYYGKERGSVNGGYLTVYARTESKEIKPRIRPAMLIMPGGAYCMYSDREGEPVAIKFLDAGFVLRCKNVLSNAAYKGVKNHENLSYGRRGIYRFSHGGTALCRRL